MKKNHNLLYKDQAKKRIHPHVKEVIKRNHDLFRLISPQRFVHTIALLSNMIYIIEESQEFDIDLNQLRDYDEQTYIHSINVSLFSILIAAQMGCQKELIREIAIGGLFHDWGKLLIPKQILHKPSGLTPLEFDIVKKHPADGERMLRYSRVSEDVLRTIRQHHERWQGQGYPDALREHQIQLQAQIVAIADVFEALTADRPYRKGLHPYHALEMILTDAGIYFAPDVVRAFRSVLSLYPAGSEVIMNTGEIGEVIAVPLQLVTRPLVRILYDDKGQRVTNGKIIDLTEELVYSIRFIRFTSCNTCTSRNKYAVDVK